VTRPRLPLLFAVWLAVFYAAWAGVVTLCDGWATAADHWPIALAMAFGSYVAGSTPMGGGTVGFPVLVLLFGMPGSLGRDFGLAIQSIGMVSASVYILASGQRVEWRLLRPAMLGSLLATTLSAASVMPRPSRRCARSMST